MHDENIIIDLYALKETKLHYIIIHNCFTYNRHYSNVADFLT